MLEKLINYFKATVGELTEEELLTFAKVIVKELTEESQIALNDYIEELNS